MWQKLYNFYSRLPENFNFGHLKRNLLSSKIGQNVSFVKIATCLVMLTVISLIVQPLSLGPLHAQNVSSTNTSMGNTTGSNVTGQSSAQVLEKLDAEMERLLKSDDPKDIAALAYIWAYAPILEKRKADFTTSPNIPPGPGRGPINSLAHFRELTNASFKDIVRPNSDTLYTVIYMDLKNEPLVLKIPPIKDRYYTLQIMDGYTDYLGYVGTRTNQTDGGSFMFTGPDWKGTVPVGVTQIKSPTNLVWNVIRILVDGEEDVPNVNALQDQMALSPLSVFEGRNTSSVTTMQSNASKEIPISSSPDLMPTTGIKIYDEISKNLAENPPPETDDELVAKFETIGIAAGKVPSTEVKNDTIRKALENGIVEGEKLILEKVKNLGSTVNGWKINLDIGRYGTDYLLRAAIANTAIGGNVPEEAVYPIAFTDSEGKPLTGANKYVIHFNKNQFPPVKAFWSITMYNDKVLFVDNPLNRYLIGDRTPGLKYNEDGSLDIYIQKENPGGDKESNWLPAATDNFSLTLRMYLPQESVLNSEYQPPPVKRVE